MRTLTYTQFGAPAEVLTLAERDVPTPGDGQVLIKMLLSPIHNHDLWTIAGSYGYRPALPAIGGTEAIGIVERAGAGVPSDLVGKRVATSGAKTWSEYFVADARGVIPLPEAIEDAAGAQLLAMPFSAIALLEFIDVAEGEWIVQSAANGAVGKILDSLARARGINVINLVRRNEAVAELEALGIGNVIPTDDTNWLERARNLVGENGARAAVDSIGGQLAGQLAELLGYKGTLVSFGSAAGEPMTLASGTVIFKQLEVKGFWGAKVIAEMGNNDKARLIGELVSLAANGTLPLTVEGVFDLADHTAAIAAALTPGRKGKVLLRA